MLPLIVNFTKKNLFDQFLKEFIEKHQIKKIIEIFPQTKQITINQIREVKKIAVYQEKEIFLILIHQFDKATLEAQNAFLKLLEEKSVNKFIILTAENLNKLLPTITSRCQIIRLGKDKKEKEEEIDKEIIELINLTLSDKNLAFLTHPLIEEVNQQKAIEILKNIILYFKNDLLTKKKNIVSLIKESSRVLNLVENNNLNPQLAIDNFLIYLNQMYNKN